MSVNFVYFVSIVLLSASWPLEGRDKPHHTSLLRNKLPAGKLPPPVPSH